MKIFLMESLYIQFIRAFCKTIQNKEVSRRLYFNSSNRYWYGCVRALYNNLLPITPCICGQNTFDPARQVSCVYQVGQGRKLTYQCINERLRFYSGYFFCTSRDWYSNQHPHCQSLFPMKSYIVKVSPWKLKIMMFIL